MKKLLAIILFILCFQLQAQTYIKANVFTTLLTIPNVGIETSIGNRFIPVYRYHFSEKTHGFYVGAHIGATLFNFQKWNYLNTNKYEEGLGYVMGATIGYKAKINEKLHLDCFIGGGSHQGFYKGYIIGTNQRYESAENYNKSGEWLPYRGGIMLSYQLK